MPSSGTQRLSRFICVTVWSKVSKDALLGVASVAITSGLSSFGGCTTRVTLISRLEVTQGRPLFSPVYFPNYSNWSMLLAFFCNATVWDRLAERGGCKLLVNKHHMSIVLRPQKNVHRPAFIESVVAFGFDATGFRDSFLVLPDCLHYYIQVQLFLNKHA